jgi:hypothetical protein
MDSDKPGEGNRPNEPPYAKKPLERGEFGIGDFHGQIFLFIPLPIYKALGADSIRAIAESVYQKVRLDVFAGSKSVYQNSYFMELPPDRYLFSKFLGALREASGKTERE